MINVARAHNLDVVRRVEDNLRGLEAFLKPLWHIHWYILPENLSPLFTGLLKQDDQATGVDPRKLSEAGGWYADERHSFWVSDVPHIYLSESNTESALHELGHALSRYWRIDVARLYKPELAFSEYGALNVEEYWATSWEIFVRPETWKDGPNETSLWKRDRRIFDVFNHIWQNPAGAYTCPPSDYLLESTPTDWNPE